ncbi:MAG: glycosyltransferase family 4 protein [Actinomycetota bacterium]|nr:glycosyltransferase family 4 protein [Actinomycetota bacterium]
MSRRAPLQVGVRTNVSRAETRLRQEWARTRMRRTSAPRVLVVDVVIPAHDRGAGHLRLTWILRLLRSLGCHLTLFTTQQRVRRDPYTKQLERLGIEVELSAESFTAFAATRGGVYDLVILSGADAAASVIDESRRAFPEASIVYDSIDLHFLRQGRKADVVGGPSERDYWHAKELGCIERSDLTATVTETEAEIVRSLVPAARTVVLPVVYEPDRTPRLPYDATSDLLFIGGFLHDPNVDAVQYFVREVLPLVSEEIDARLWVIGQHPPEEIRALESASVVVTGHVPDVGHHLRRARVFVSPVRYGAGMKGKNVHAMAHGLPLVTTTIGAEGMDLVDGQHALIRDGAQAFAAAVVALYRDPALWARLATSSREVARTRWSPAAMRARLDGLLDATVRSRAARRP